MQKALYTAKIFEVLYQNFPVPYNIDQKEIISDLLLFDKHEELKQLKTKKEKLELIEHSFSETLRPDNFYEELENAKNEWLELEIERRQEEIMQLELFQGTVNFFVVVST